MRYLGLVVVVTLLAGAACGGSTVASLRLGDTFFGGSGPLHYAPNEHFRHDVLLENRTGAEIVVTAAHVVEPQHTLMHQIRAEFSTWNPPHCGPQSGLGCGIYSAPRRADPTRPLGVPRGQGVVVQLRFSLSPCAEIPSANSAPIDNLSVTYRQANGQTRTEVVPLERTAIRLQMPKPEDCAQPRSDLKVQAPGPTHLFTSSYSTRPGSTGDTCSIAGGTLSFESRLYLLYVRERVYVQIPHFRGKGLYTDGIARLVARQHTVFRTDTATVRVTNATTREVYAHIFAGRYAHHGERIAPFKIVGTMRCKLTG